MHIVWRPLPTGAQPPISTTHLRAGAATTWDIGQGLWLTLALCMLHSWGN